MIMKVGPQMLKMKSNDKLGLQSQNQGEITFRVLFPNY